MTMSNQKDLTARQIARAIVMAQIASDAGKKIYDLRLRGDRGPNEIGYGLKEAMIIRALRMIDTNPKMGFNYWCEMTPDQNGYPSILIYFDIKADGRRLQVSFHNPRSCKALKKWINKGRKTRWDRVRYGSRSACTELIEIFDL